MAEDEREQGLNRESEHGASDAGSDLPDEGAETDDFDEDEDDEDGSGAAEMRAAADAVELVILPLACTNEGKGAPLAMGIQRYWAQELATLGLRAAAPVFTAMAEHEGRKVPALMIFREPWTQERARDGVSRFPNATKGLLTTFRADSDKVALDVRLVRIEGESLVDVATFAYEGTSAELPSHVHEVTLGILRALEVSHESTKDWQTAFGSKNTDALISFLVGLGNLSALQGRCVPTTPEQLLSPLVDAIARDPSLDAAMQAVHVMVDLLVRNPIDQTAIPLALQALDAVSKRRPRDPSGYHHLGVLFRQLGDVASSAQALNQAFNIEPQNGAVAVAFIETLRSGGDRENAIKVAQFAAEHGNEAPALFAHLGSLMIENDQFDEAEPFLRRAIEEGQVPSAYGDLANVLWDRGDGGEDDDDHKEALELLQKAVDAEQVAKSTLDMLLDLHEEEGIEAATLLLLRAAERHQDHPTVLRYVSTMYLDGDHPENARPHLEKLLSLPNRSLDDDAFARRGLLTLDLEDFEDTYDQAIDQVRSDDPDAQLRAAKFLRQVIAKDPKFWQPHLMLALAVRRSEGDSAALAHLQDAVVLRPNDAEIRQLIAAILRKQGRPRDAVDHLRAIVALNPRDIDPVVALAACMRDANLFEDARQVCQAALQMVPNHPEFKKILESLPAPPSGRGTPT